MSILATVFGMMVFSHPEIKLLVLVSMRALQLFLESKNKFPSSTVRLARFIQPANGYFPIVFTDLGIVTLVSD